jgi:hypothetical protein
MTFLNALIPNGIATQKVFAFVKRDASTAPEDHPTINCPHREKSMDMKCYAKTTI